VVYDEATDYAGYKIPDFPFYPADPEHFFVFFPNQPHLPGVHNGEKTQVRKIVFKIKVD
jgi:beta-galactosidase beta subunit